MAKSKNTRIASAPGYVSYLRTSDEDAQAPERSQNGQRRDIKQLVALYTLPDLGEYVDNFTGTTSDRTHYQQMLADARLGKFSHVFASVPDRFGRDDVEALRAIDEMTKLGITVRFASHPDLNPADEDDRLYLNILFGMAKREAAVTARRTKGGMLSKVMAGGWSWRAPDGYVNKEIRLTQLGPEEQLKHAKYKRWVELDPEQGKVWRMAWDLLLTDQYTLAEICEKLDEQGFHMTSGRPFVQVKKTRKNPVGNRKPNVGLVSRAFHNWFYAGWSVVDNECGTVAPKTAKGEWEPIVSTEEFERGLAILAQRNHHPMPVKKYFYLLQGLIYLETEDGLRKLTCGTPHSSRGLGGTPYYCIPSSSNNYLCRRVDVQIGSHIAASQIDPDKLPDIRKEYRKDVARYTKDDQRERKILEGRQRKLEEKELNLWRAFTGHGMRPQIYEKLTRECQDERKKLEMLVRSLKEERSNQLASLDAALAVITGIGERFDKCTPEQQRAILLQMVERVVINPEGKLVRVDWKAPFSYLIGLNQGNTSSRKKTTKTARNAKTSGVSAGPLQNPLGAPTGPSTHILLHAASGFLPCLSSCIPLE